MRCHGTRLGGLRSRIISVRRVSANVSVVSLKLGRFHLSLLRCVGRRPSVRGAPFKLRSIATTTRNVPTNIVFILGGHAGDIGVSGRGHLRPFCVICVDGSNRIIYSRLSPGRVLSGIHCLYGNGARPVPRLCGRFGGRAQSNGGVSRVSSLLNSTVSSVVRIGSRDSVSDFLSNNRMDFLSGRVGKLGSFRLVYFVIMESARRRISSGRFHIIITKDEGFGSCSELTNRLSGFLGNGGGIAVMDNATENTSHVNRRCTTRRNCGASRFPTR